MSRARHTTQIYATADDAATAVEDLTFDWNNERRPRWAIDTGLPATAAAPGHETELSQAQLASVLAIARHEQTGPDDERRRAAIQAVLDRHRTTLPDVEFTGGAPTTATAAVARTAVAVPDPGPWHGHGNVKPARTTAALDEAAAVAELVRHSRLAQGLPEKVEDPVTIGRVAAVLRLAAAESHHARRVS